MTSPQALITLSDTMQTAIILSAAVIATAVAVWSLVTGRGYDDFDNDKRED